jgi:cell division GTPase FtsZ
MLSLVGVGGAGCKIVELFFRKDLVGSIISKISSGAGHVRGVAIDTSESITELSNIPSTNMVLIGSSRAKGHGTGGSVEMGKKIMEEELELAMSTVRKANTEKPEMIFLITGIGGGTGTGGAPILAERIKITYNVPLLGILILPARSEGALYTKNTFENFDKFIEPLDGVIVLDNNVLANRGEDFITTYMLVDKAVFNFLSMVNLGDILRLATNNISTVGFMRMKAEHVTIKEIIESAIRNHLYYDIEGKEFEKINLIIYGNLAEVYGQSFAKNWIKEKYDAEVDYIFTDDKGSKYLNIGLVITGLKDVTKGFEIKEDKKAMSDLDDLLGDIKPLF